MLQWKIMRNIQIIFDIENWLWKSNLAQILVLLRPSRKTNSQYSIISFEYVDSYAKIFLLLYPPTWKLHNSYCHSMHILAPLLWSISNILGPVSRLLIFIRSKSCNTNRFSWLSFSNAELINYQSWLNSLVKSYCDRFSMNIIIVNK